MDSASNGLSLGTTIDRSVSGHNSTAPDRSLDHDTRQVEPAASGCMVAVIENRAKEVGHYFEALALL